MRDGRDPPQAYWHEELRRRLTERRRQYWRLTIAAVVGCAAMPLAASTLWKPPILIVWNASASAPIGLYRVHGGGPIRRGDMVVAWTSGPARMLAARRRYLPANVPLVKRVAAAAGDRVCAAGSRVSINGGPVAMRQKSDAAGRPMPWWSGCRHLHVGEYFLLMDHRQSFDGRYFGVTRADAIIGRAQLLWTKPAKGSHDG